MATTTTILCLFFLVAATAVMTAFAQYEDNFKFRVANHLGPDPPVSIKIKTCGLASVSLNGKDSGRLGLSYDIPTEMNPTASGICAGPCSGNKRDVATTTGGVRGEDDEDTGLANALYATDSVINFHIYWRQNADPSKVLTRISKGDVAYLMGADSAVWIEGVSSAQQYVTSQVPGVSPAVFVEAKQYPTATFQFNDENKVVMQNWYLQRVSSVTCEPTSGGSNLPANDAMTQYAAGSVTNDNLDSQNFKSRIRFDLAEGGVPLGTVQVLILWNSAASLFEKHIRTDGTDGSWLTDISVKLTTVDDNGNTLTTLFDDDTTAVAQANQWCTTQGMSSVPLGSRSDNQPLAKSSR